MDEENRKNEAEGTTSKEESHRCNSAEELYNKGSDERRTNSNYSDSATYSKQSQVDVADAHMDATKLLGRKEVTTSRKRKPRRDNGRVEKRRRSYHRRPVRKMQKKYNKPREYRKGRRSDRRILSVSSILSDLSRTGVQKCLYCGHRCCRRRFTCRRCGRHRMKKTKYQRYRKPERTRRVGRKPVRTNIANKKISEQNQVGAPCVTLSPLFVNTNFTLREAVDTAPDFREITPEIIYESLEYLSKWRWAVESSFLMVYIARNYPVNPDEKELLKELKLKLAIASLAGIATEIEDDKWCLSSLLLDRRLTHNHVTIFWTIYADTMKPIEKKEVQEQNEEVIKEEKNFPTKKKM